MAEAAPEAHGINALLDDLGIPYTQLKSRTSFLISGERSVNITAPSDTTYSGELVIEACATVRPFRRVWSV